jgi:hypothetical protein
MKRTRFSPGGQSSDQIEFLQDLRDHLAGVLPSAEHVQVRDDPLQSAFSLTDGAIRIVLALPLEAPMVLEEFLPKELGKTVASRTAERTNLT